MENHDVNRDKFLDLMAKHHLDAGVNVVRLWNKAQEGDDIRTLAREFIADRLGQCLAAWECAALAVVAALFWWGLIKEWKDE